MQDKIYIKGARENNLKNVDVEIPRDKLVGQLIFSIKPFCRDSSSCMLSDQLF